MVPEFYSVNWPRSTTMSGDPSSAVDVTTISDDALSVSLIPPAKAPTSSEQIPLDIFIDRLSADGNRAQCCICNKSFARSARTVVNHFYLHVDKAFHWLRCAYLPCTYTSFSYANYGPHRRNDYGNEQPRLQPIVDDITELFYDATLREAHLILDKTTATIEGNNLAARHLREIFLSNHADGSCLSIETTTLILQQCPSPWVMNLVQCPVCCKRLRFAQRVFFIDHLYLHMPREQYPYQCPYAACDHATTRKLRMEEHYTSKHGLWSEDVANRSYDMISDNVYRALRETRTVEASPATITSQIFPPTPYKEAV